MEKHHCIFVQNDIEKMSQLEDTMFLDLINHNAVSLIRENSRDILTSLAARRKIQRLLSVLVNSWLGKRYLLGKLLDVMGPETGQIDVIFVNTAFTTVRYPAKVLKQYKKKWPQIRYVLYYMDSVCRGVSDYANYLREENVFDAVYTFDEADAKTYGMIFWRTPYSCIPEYTEIKPDQDAYFVGVADSRIDILREIAAVAKVEGQNLLMDIICHAPQEYREQITDNISLHTYEQLLPYEEALRRSLQARCIVDVVRSGQVGLTLRAYEAVVYNRKLLTNNKTILSFPYYNPRYMQYFETVEDIDWDWVKEEIEVDYHYNGEFSPLRLMENIIESCEEK